MKHNWLINATLAIILALLTACGPEQPSPTPARVPTETQPPLSGVRVSTLSPPASDTPVPAAATEMPVPSTVAPVASATTGCTLQAAFIADVTIPDSSVVAPGSQFVKTWRVRNSGTCDWGSGLKTVFVEGNQLGGPSVVSLEPVDAGRTLDIAITLKAPTNPGTYQGKWQLRAPNGAVLTGLTVSIVVQATPTPTGPPTVTPKPSPVPTFAGAIESFVGLWLVVESSYGNNVTDTQRLQQLQIQQADSQLKVSPATGFGSPYSFGLVGFASTSYSGGNRVQWEFDDPALGRVTIEMVIQKACNAWVYLSYTGYPHRRFILQNFQSQIPCV